MNTLYHKKVYMPKKYRNLKTTSLEIGELTRHAIKSANSDRYGQIIIPMVFNFSGRDIVEIETYENPNKLKIVIRLPYSQTCDLILVVLFETDGNRVKTCWLNRKDDRHATLDRSKYRLV